MDKTRWGYSCKKKGIWFYKKESTSRSMCWSWSKKDLKDHFIRCGLTNLEYLEGLDLLNKRRIIMRKGTQHTEETKVKIAAAKLGKTFTEEHSQAISVALKGRKKSEAHKAAIASGIRAAHANKVVIQNTTVA